MLKSTSSETASRYDHIEQAFRKQWQLGREIIVCWTYTGQGLTFLSIPYYLIGTLISAETELTDSYLTNPEASGDGISLVEILKGSRYTSEATLSRITKLTGVSAITLSPPGTNSSEENDSDQIDNLVRRYSISYVENHAVALFDIVGFSKHSPLDQVTLLSSLSYSINSAYSKLQEQNIKVNFARTTTGDGFYIWSKEVSVESNINLYNLVQLILADNAIAHTKTYGHTAPILKTAFHIGNYYEFHQSEALQPTPYSYIVGNVTIELARIIEIAVAGQILVGDFHCHLPSPDDPSVYINVDTINFIDILKEKVHGLEGIQISDKEIASIECYLTGQRVNEREFSISRFQITDKHLYLRTVFNAKVNIYRNSQSPIYLGIQEKDVPISPRIRRI